jgi:RNA recognition motif-containing protein
MASTKLSTEIIEKKKSKKSKTFTSIPIDSATQLEIEESVAIPGPDKKKKKSKKSKSTTLDVLESAPEAAIEDTATLEPSEKKKKKKKEKEKKSKKLKTSDLPAEEIASLVVLSDDDTKPSKKRKRPAATEDEIEIDVALPEPLSKKAARKAKKVKTTDPSKSTAEGSDEEAEPTVPNSGPKEKKERRTAWGIWIGNLPWSASKSDVKEFLCKHAGLDMNEITRVHMPVPSNAPARNGEKPKNKGFAYLDFDSAEALEAAIKVSETQFNNDQRKVLIKKSSSFEGRPEPKTEEEAKKDDNGLSTLAADKMNAQKPPSKRVFVGNLGFDTTKDDLQNHFGQCGEIVDVFMATFEDSGKCKGFAWVTFTSEDAGIAAVRGWIIKGKEQDSDSELESEAEGEKEAEAEAPGKEGQDETVLAELKAEGYENVDNKETQSILKQRLAKSKQKKRKVHKWFVNKMFGRALRCEFAEDAGVRYKKRYGKDAQKKDGEDVIMGEGGDADAAEAGDANEGTWKEKKWQSGKKMESTPHERRKEARRAANKREFGNPPADSRVTDRDPGVTAAASA